MAELKGLELGIKVTKCEECDYRNDSPREVKFDPERDMLLVMAKMLCKPEHLRKVREGILQQAATGVAIIPCGFDVMVVPKDAEFWKG